MAAAVEDFSSYATSKRTEKRTGKDFRPTSPQKKTIDQRYPRWIGQKFEPNGSVLPFPGNTIICHLSPESNLYRSLLGLFEDLKKNSFDSSFVLLPPDSWHMTVSEGISDRIREAELWAADLSLDTPLQQCTDHVEQKLVDFDLGCQPPFHMAVQGWEPLEDGIALNVVPATAEEERRLRVLRDRLAEHLQIRHPSHDVYSFHVSLTYSLRYFTPEETEEVLSFLEAQRTRLPPTFELGAPEFCVFDDMFAFRRKFYLGGSQ